MAIAQDILRQGTFLTRNLDLAEGEILRNASFAQRENIANQAATSRTIQDAQTQNIANSISTGEASIVDINGTPSLRFNRGPRAGQVVPMQSSQTEALRQQGFTIAAPAGGAAAAATGIPAIPGIAPAAPTNIQATATASPGIRARLGTLFGVTPRRDAAAAASAAPPSFAATTPSARSITGPVAPQPETLATGAPPGPSNAFLTAQAQGPSPDINRGFETVKKNGSDLAETTTATPAPIAATATPESAGATVTPEEQPETQAEQATQVAAAAQSVDTDTAGVPIPGDIDPFAASAIRGGSRETRRLAINNAANTLLSDNIGVESPDGRVVTATTPLNEVRDIVRQREIATGQEEARADVVNRLITNGQLDPNDPEINTLPLEELQNRILEETRFAQENILASQAVAAGVDTPEGTRPSPSELVESTAEATIRTAATNTIQSLGGSREEAAGLDSGQVSALATQKLQEHNDAVTIGQRQLLRDLSAGEAGAEVVKLRENRDEMLKQISVSDAEGLLVREMAFRNTLTAHPDKFSRQNAKVEGAFGSFTQGDFDDYVGTLDPERSFEFSSLFNDQLALLTGVMMEQKSSGLQQLGRAISELNIQIAVTDAASTKPLGDAPGVTAARERGDISAAATAAVAEPEADVISVDDKNIVGIRDVISTGRILSADQLKFIEDNPTALDALTEAERDEVFLQRQSTAARDKPEGVQEQEELKLSSEAINTQVDQLMADIAGLRGAGVPRPNVSPTGQPQAVFGRPASQDTTGGIIEEVIRLKTIAPDATIPTAKIQQEIDRINSEFQKKAAADKIAGVITFERPMNSDDALRIRRLELALQQFEKLNNAKKIKASATAKE